MASKKRILITGAGGFIGSHLTEQLVKLGYNVCAFIEYNSFGSKGWLDHLDGNVTESMDIFFGDVRDPNAVRTAMKGCDNVIHLAALIGIPYSYIAPDSYVDTNVKGTLNVIQAARDLDVERLLHTSTSEVYGTAKFVPITESHPLQGQSPYSATKIAADQIAFSFFSSFETPVVILRPFNCFGPRQSTRAVIPSIIMQILSGQKEIRLGSLTPTRDFNFVDDIVNGFVSALTGIGGEGEVVNLGSNFEISIESTVKLIAEIMGAEVKVLLDEQRLRPRASEVERLWADNKKAYELFGWSPEVAGAEGMRIGLEKTARWFADPQHTKMFDSLRYGV